MLVFHEAQKFGDRMKKAREAKGLSKTKLSQISGVHYHTICNIENGTNSPTLDTVALLAGALGISIAEYVGE